MKAPLNFQIPRQVSFALLICAAFAFFPFHAAAGQNSRQRKAKTPVKQKTTKKTASGKKAAQAKVLTLAEIMTALRSKKASPEVKNRLIIEGIKTRGISFPLTAEIEAELKATGAADELIEAIREKINSTARQLPPEAPDISNESFDYFVQPLPGGIRLEMVKILPGTFLMGSPLTEKQRNGWEGRQRQITIDYQFFIGKFEVTQEQYDAVMGDNPSRFKDCPACPVENISWFDAQEFIRKLNQASDKYRFRLPSEAEWEYAARAGSVSAFAFGDNLSSAQANFDGHFPYGNATTNVSRDMTTAAGSFPPNAWGLYDMHGNVFEWCEDFWGKVGNAPTDGSANTSNGNPKIRVIRGGSWFNEGHECRSAHRFGEDPTSRTNYIGFRLVAVEK